MFTCVRVCSCECMSAYMCIDVCVVCACVMCAVVYVYGRQMCVYRNVCVCVFV